MNKNLKNSNMSKVLYTFIIVNLMFPTEMIYAAGIKLDESVSKQYNSRIGKTKNGIDQIDIVNPNKGISHNKFLEYNVDQRGVILNNSKDLVQTNLAGLIDGNANLTNNANLIITEITGTNRSDIEGFTEVAGQRADYVLANPNGVYLNGAGFINIDRVTISTGKVMNDGNLALQIKDGIIEVGNKGVSTENVDYFTLLSRVAKINGVIASNSKENATEEIEILTGKNEYDYKTKKLTTIDSKNDGKYNVAIDASKLGGLMAGRIKLVGTEQGLGVNTTNLVAPQSVKIDSQGVIKTKDILTKNLDINSRESKLNGTIKANSISISGESINSGNILADRVIAKVFESDGEVIATEYFSADDLKNRSNLNSKKIDLGTLDNSGNLHSETLNLKGNSRNSSAIVANEIIGGNFDNSGALQGNESIQLDDLTNKIEGTVLSKNIVTKKITNEGKIQAKEKLETGDLINKGKILAKNTTIKGNLTNADRIDSNLEVQGENHLNTGLILGDTLKISSNLKNTGTLIGKESIQLENVINENDILSNKNIVIENIENKTTTSKLAGENIDAKIIKNSGLIQGNVSVDDLENKGNVRGEAIRVSSKLFNSGRMISNDLNVTSETLLNEGTIGAKKTTLNSTNLLNRGNLISDILNMNIEEKIDNTGYIKTDDFITNAKLDNSGNIIADKIDLTNDLKNSGLIKGNLKISNDLLENKGNLEGDIISITSKTINNSKNILGDAAYINGRFINTGTGVIGSQNLNINGDIDNTGILVSDDIALKSKTITNKGDIKATNSITMNSTNLINENKILANKNIDIESSINNSGKISGNIKIRGGQDSATSIINTGELSGNVDIKSNILKNTGGTIKGDTVKIDHVADEKLGIEGIYLANNLEIIAKKSIDNKSNSIKASKGIKLTSHKGEILNDGKIIAGEDIILTAKNIKNGIRKTGLEVEADRESLIESGRNLNIKGNYINTTYGTLIGGLGRTNLTMANDLINYGKIISRGSLEVNSANFLNNGQVLAGQDLKIKADKIENNEDKLIYAKANMTLDGQSIQNEMGTILTTDGDITLKATENINNKANALKGGKIKAGNTLNIIAKNYENEGYKYQDGYFTNLYNPNGFANGKSWEQFLDASVSGSQRRILNWKNYGFSSFFRVVNGGTVEGAYNKEWDGDWHYGAPSGDTQYYEVGGTVKINAIKSPIRVRQSITEAKNINVELTEDFKNRGIVTAENNIHIKAKNIINETEVINASGVSEYKGKAQAVVIKTNLVTAHKWYSDGPRIYDIKTKKYINIAEEKARITAGGNITLDGNVINTDTENLENLSGITTNLQDTIVQNQTVSVEGESKDVDKDSKQSEISGVTDEIKNDETEKINEVNEDKDKTDEKEKEIEKNSQNEDEMINQENKNTQESLANQEELIRNQLETQKKLNVSDYIELPKGNHGLFKKNEEFDKISNNRPLIETNISFIDKSKYFGSDYFFEKIKYTPDNIRTLGDSYYDTTLINDVLKRNFERGKAVNEIATMKNLLDNASKSHKELGLKVGEKLTTEQLNNLDHDIVWYVEVEVDGHKVLAPQLYVAKKGLEGGPDSSSIDGQNITVKNGSLLNTGNIEAQNIINVDATQIINKNTIGKAKIKGENVYLQAQNDIKNIGSAVEGTNILLSSKDGDIVNESLVEKNQLLESENYTTEIIGVSKIKGETINIKGNNYFQKGAILSGKDGSLDIKNEIKIEGLKLESKTKESGYKLAEAKTDWQEMEEKRTGKATPKSEIEYSGTKYEKETVSTENVGSILNFSGNLVAKAGNDINVLGSNITAKEALIQGKNINVEGVKDVNDSSYKTSKKEFAYSKDEDIQNKTEKVLESKIKTQGDLTLVGIDGDITFKGSSRESGGTIRSLAEKGSVKDLTLETNNIYKRTAREIGFNGQTLGESKEVTDARKNVLDEDGIQQTKGTNAKLKHSSNAGIETDVDNLHSRGFITGTNHSELYASASATVGLVISDIDEEVNSKLHTKTTVKAKEEIILAKGDVIRESITGNIEGDSTVKSLEGDIKYTTASDVVTSNVDKTTYSMGNEYSYRVAPLEFVEKIKKKIDYSNNSSYSAKNAKANGKETPGEGAEALARMAEVGGDISKLVSGEVASLSSKSGVNITDTNKKSNKSTALENELNIGGTQTFIGKNVSLEGIKGEIGNLNIKAKKLDVKAAKDTYTENNDGFSLFAGSQGSASLNTDGGSLSAEGAVDFAYIDSDTDSSTYKTGNINVKNKVDLDIEKDVNFEGLGIKGKDVTAKIGGDLNIKSLQNKVDHKAININANASAGVALNSATGGVPTPTATLGATYGQVTENKAWVKEQAGLTSTNEYNVDVKGKTNLVGAKLGSETAGKTKFSTKELTTKDLKDTHDRGGFYAGGGASFGKSGVGGVDIKGGNAEGYERAQDTKTTIGTGNIKINGEDAELDDVNRDFDKSQVKTKDKVIFKTDFDYSIGMPKKNKKKKNKTSSVDSDISTPTPKRKNSIDNDTDSTYNRKLTDNDGSNPNKGRPLPEIPIESSNKRKLTDTDNDNIYDEIGDNNINPKKNPNKGRPLPEIPTETSNNRKLTDIDNDNDGVYNKLNEVEKKSSENIYDKTSNDDTYNTLNEVKKQETENIYGKASGKEVEINEEHTYFILEKEDKAPNKKVAEADGEEHTYFVLEKEDKAPNKKTAEENVYETLEKSKMNSENVYDKLENVETPNKKVTDGEEHKYFILEKEDKAPNKKVAEADGEEHTYFVLEKEDKTSNKKVSQDEIYDTIDESKVNPDNIYDEIGDININPKKSPNKGRPLPELPSKKEVGTDIKETVKNKGFSADEGNKVHKEAVAKLKTIADSADNLPTEHLMKALNDITGLDVNEYDKLTRDPKTGKINVKAREYFQKTLTAKGLGNSEVKKSLDKIFKALNKPSKEYKVVKQKLDSSLVGKLENNPEFKELMKEKLTGNKENLEKLFNMVEEAKHESFKEVTGIDSQRAKLTIDKGGKATLTQGGYANNKVKINESPLGSFLRSRKANNEEILNTFIHELTHHDQEQMMKNKNKSELKDVKKEAEIFKKNNDLYIHSGLTDMKKYKRQPLEKEAFETGDKLGKDLIKKVSQRDNPQNDVKELDLSKYNQAKEGIIGEEGHTYKLSPKKEGKILANIEKSYEESKAKYLNEPTDANLKEFKIKEKAFEENLKKYNKKIDLILKQEDIKQENVLDKETDSSDKYNGKLVTIKKEDIGVVKPVKKVEKQKLTAEQKKDYSKGKIGQYFKGKPDIVDPKMRPENIGEVKDNTVNILIHGTFSAKSAENDWASSKSVHAKSINEQYGGEAVSFKWSGKNTADTRKEAGKELAKIIEGYNKKGIQVNVIAHSHGGNVANEALKLTNGKIDNLVTLGTPVRSDHKADAKIIESKTNSYLNVMSNEDTVTRQGGFDTKTDVTKYIGGDNAFRRAHRKDKDADKVLKIDGASHSELHSLAVIKQLKPLTKRIKVSDTAKEESAPTKKFKGNGSNKKTNEKTPDSAVKKLKTIADNVDSIPKEHLLLTLEQMGFGLSMEDGQKLLAEAKKHPERKVIYPETVNVENKEVKKSLDKIFGSLGKQTSEEYKAVKRKLDDSLTAKLEGNSKFKKLMKEKLTGDKEKIQKLFDMVEEAKYDSFKEVTGLDTPRANLTINDGGKLSLTQGGYAKNNVETNTSPLGSFFRSRKANNEEILNTLIHELTHQDQDKLAKNKDDLKIKSINDEARVFNINDKLYIDANLKDSGKYKRQPLEKEAFETGNNLAKDLMENINK